MTTNHAGRPCPIAHCPEQTGAFFLCLTHWHQLPGNLRTRVRKVWENKDQHNPKRLAYLADDCRKAIAERARLAQETRL